MEDNRREGAPKTVVLGIVSGLIVAAIVALLGLLFASGTTDEDTANPRDDGSSTTIAPPEVDDSPVDTADNDDKSDNTDDQGAEAVIDDSGADDSVDDVDQDEPIDAEDEPTGTIGDAPTEDPDHEADDPPVASGPIVVELDPSTAVNSERCSREGNTGFNWSSGPANIDGSSYSRVLSCPLQRGAVGVYEFDLGKDYLWAGAMVGFLDDAETTVDRATFEMLNENNQVLATATLGFGESQLLEANVADVLRLRLRITKLTDSGVEPSAGFAGAYATDGAEPEPISSTMVTALPGGFEPTLANYVAVQRCKRDGNTGFPFEDDPIRIAGDDYSPSLRCSLQRGAEGWLEYDLSRAYSSFSADVGFADDSPSTTDRVRFEIFGDGVKLAEATVEFGDRATIETSVEGVLRLRLGIIKLTDTGDRPDAGFVNAIAQP